MRISEIAVALAGLLVGCGGGTGSSSSGSSGGSTGGNQVQPHLSSLQPLVFTPSCALSSCHGGAVPQDHLDLEAGKTYASVVNVASSRDPSWKLVVPGDPDHSLLYQVLLGPVPDAGIPDRMPQNGDPLPQASIDAVKTWIANGAPND